MDQEVEQILNLVHIHEDPSEIFELLDPLGDGSYGYVYKGLHKRTGEIMAIKVVPVSATDIQSSIKEMEILGRCDSPFIVTYYGAYYRKDHLWLVMEFCEAGSVIDILKITKRPFTEVQIASILESVLFGMDYLHQNKLIHRDIKAANILLDKDGNTKIADFGVSAQLMSTLGNKDSMIGTPFWMSPEVIAKSRYNNKTDIWSFGITSIELAEGKPPYSDLHYIKAMHKIKNSPPQGLKENGDYSPEFRDFVKRCLTFNPEERPTARELLQHPFIAKSQGKKVLSQLVADSMEMIENYRLERSNMMKRGKSDGSIQRIDSKEIKEDKYEYNETGTVRVRTDLPDTSLLSEENYETNDSGTMVVKGNPIEEENSESEDMPETGTIVYHDDEPDFGTTKIVEGTGNEQNQSDYMNYVKMYREMEELDYKYKLIDLEDQLGELCKNLTYYQKISDMNIFRDKVDELRDQMKEEIQMIKKKYTSKIIEIEKIICTKKKVEDISSLLKTNGVDVDSLDCMKKLKKPPYKKKPPPNIEIAEEQIKHSEDKMNGIKYKLSSKVPNAKISHLKKQKKSSRSNNNGITGSAKIINPKPPSSTKNSYQRHLMGKQNFMSNKSQTPTYKNFEKFAKPKQIPNSKGLSEKLKKIGIRGSGNGIRPKTGLIKKSKKSFTPKGGYNRDFFNGKKMTNYVNAYKSDRGFDPTESFEAKNNILRSYGVGEYKGGSKHKASYRR